MEKFIKKSKTLSPDIRPFAISLVNNELPLLRTGPGVSNLEGTVIEMAVHAATILLCGQSQVLGPLKNLAFFPHLMVVRLGYDFFCIHRENLETQPVPQKPLNLFILSVCHRPLSHLML